MSILHKIVTQNIKNLEAEMNFKYENYSIIKTSFFQEETVDEAKTEKKDADEYVEEAKTERNEADASDDEAKTDRNKAEDYATEYSFIEEIQFEPCGNCLNIFNIHEYI